jgi:uncharacterized membrane protein
VWTLVVLAFQIYMLYQTYNNQRVKIPVIGDFAEKQA